MSLYDDLPNPPVDGLSPREREYIAYDLTVVGRTARERANTLWASGNRGVELAVVELRDLAARVLERADRYQRPGRAPNP